MTTADPFEIFLVAVPGLELVLCAEARAIGYRKAATVKGGVTLNGTWPDVWGLNLELRARAGCSPGSARSKPIT